MSTWLAEAPSSRSRLSSWFWMSFSWVLGAAQTGVRLELQSMERVCLVLAILDLYIVGVNTRNRGLQFLKRKI